MAFILVFKHFFFSITVLAALVLTGCFTSGNYLYVEGKGDIALVSFSIDRRINHEKDSSAHDGPALLTTKESKEAFWDFHIQSINEMYKQFRDKFSEVFPGTNLVLHETVSNNEKYQQLSEHKPKIILGKDVSLGWSQINPDGLNWVSGFGKEKLDSLCSIFNVNLVMSVECKARWKVDTTYRVPSGFAMEEVNLGHIVLDASVYLHEKGKGMVWSRNYRKLEAKDRVRLEWSSGEPPQMDKRDFPAQLQSAFKKIFPELIEDVNRGKAAMQQQQTQEL